MLNRGRPTQHRDSSQVVSLPIFVTCCTKDRKPLLANQDSHTLVQEAFRMADQWAVGQYLIMPDHLHFFVRRCHLDSCHLDDWMHYFKSLVGKGWNNPNDKPIWQRKHWDMEMKSEELYAQTLEYVLYNPVRARLVSHIEEWPYKGMISELRF